MDFQIGLSYGTGFLFSNVFVNSTLTIEDERLVISRLLASTLEIKKERIIRLSDYEPPWWCFNLMLRAMDSLRVEHNDPELFPFIVLWSLDLTEVRNQLGRYGIYT